MEDTCTWKRDSDDIDYWETDCNLTWSTIDGGLEENNMNYCPQCGKRIKEVWEVE